MHHPTTTPNAGAAIPIEGTHNFRSTEGYPGTAGSIRPRGLFRSDALHRVSAAGKHQFTEQGIVRVIDLRSDAELAQAPTVFSAADVETIHHPIFTDATPPLDGGSLSLGSLYRHIVTERADRLAAAVQLIADAPAGGVLVHCTAGKDRTGLVVAAALAAVGVPREQIVADYAASAENLAGEWADAMLAGAAAQFGSLDADIQELITGSPAAVMAETLDFVEQRLGGFTELLEMNGVDAAGLDRLRSRLIGPAPTPSLAH